MNYNLKKLLIYLLIITPKVYAPDSIVTLFVAKYPYLKKSKPENDQATESKALRQPDFVYKSIVQGQNSTRSELPGIMCLYAGRGTMSNQYGQITFPRQQQTPNMYLLITKGIKPAYMIAPSTIHNWLIDTNLPTEMYYAEFKHDPTTLLYYYDIQKKELPKNNVIPRNTLIFISDPKDMYLPVGATITEFSSNIILPTIYIKRHFCFIYNSLYTLAIKQYFAQPNIALKQDGQTVAEIQQIRA